MFIGEMSVKGRVLFQDATKFNFGDTGLTVVHGLNTNGGHRNTNAAGKSLLMSTLQDLLYRDVLVGSRRDRVTDGYVSLEFGKTREDKYKLVHSKKKLQVSKDGSSLEIREQAEVDKLVKAILPTSIEAYSTLIHLDNRVPHPLIRGETDARKKFFTKFFDLDTTDPLRKLASLGLADIKSSGKLLTDKRSRHAHLVEHRQNTAELKKKLRALQAKRDSMQTIIDEYQEQAALRQFVTEHKDALGNVPDLRALSKRVTAIEHELEGAEALADYSAELRAWKKSKIAHDAYMETHQIVDPPSELDACKRALKDIEDYKENYADLTIEIKQIKQKLEDLVDPSTEHGTNGGVCDTCGAVLTGKLMQKHKQAQEVALDRYTAKRKELRAKGKELTIKRAALSEPPGDAADVEQRMAVLRELPKLSAKPEKPDTGGTDTEVDVDALRAELKKLQAKKDKFFWARGDLFRQAQEIQDVEAFLNIDDPTTAYMRLVDRLSSASMEYEVSKKADVEIAELEAFIEESEKAATKAEALTILEKAYGTRGIRKVLINTVCQRLEEVLNSYSKALLPEDYVFSLEMDTQFRIEVTRNGALPSDVRRLSGAESSLFSLLLWAGLMSFVPKAARPNVLILDELDANMGDETKERFCEFIPKLLSVVEHVVVVTPHSEVRYEDYVPTVKYVTVVKQGQTAKIVSGKACDIKVNKRGKNEHNETEPSVPVRGRSRGENVRSTRTSKTK